MKPSFVLRKIQKKVCRRCKIALKPTASYCRNCKRSDLRLRRIPEGKKR